MTPARGPRLVAPPRLKATARRVGSASGPVQRVADGLRRVTDLRLTLRAEGDAEPAEVWERYARPDRWASWSPTIRDVRYPAPRIAAGGAGTVIGPLGLPVPFVIDAVDELDRWWSWRVAVGPARLQLEHKVLSGTSADASPVSTTLTITGPAPVALGYVPLALLAIGRLVRAEPA